MNLIYKSDRVAYLPLQSEKAKSAPPEEFVPTSSFLQSVSFDSSASALTLHFTNGYTSVHNSFTPMAYQQFVLAPSHGSYYARQIKTQYPASPVMQPVKVSDLKKAREEYAPEVDDAN